MGPPLVDWWTCGDLSSYPFQGQHTHFPSCQKCWWLIAKNWVYHQDLLSATRKYINKLCSIQESGPSHYYGVGAVTSDGGTQRHRLFASKWGQLWRAPELLVELAEASAAITSELSFFCCPVMPFSLPHRCNAQELLPLNLHATLHSRVCFLGTQSKTFATWIEPFHNDTKKRLEIEKLNNVIQQWTPCLCHT